LIFPKKRLNRGKGRFANRACLSASPYLAPARFERRICLGIRHLWLGSDESRYNRLGIRITDRSAFGDKACQSIFAEAKVCDQVLLWMNGARLEVFWFFSHPSENSLNPIFGIVTDIQFKIPNRGTWVVITRSRGDTKRISFPT